MSKNTSSESIGFWSLLGLAFIVLKLTGVINWSWWYVLMPLYGGFILVMGILLIYGVYKVLTHKRAKKKMYQKIFELDKPKRPNRFQQKMREMMEQAENQKKSPQN